MVPHDDGYGNEGYRKAEEQFPEGLWKRSIENRL